MSYYPSTPPRLPVRQVTQTAIDLLFATYADVARAGTYNRDGSTATVTMLVFPVHHALADGTVIKPGDDKILIRAADVAMLGQPRAGDTIDELDVSQRWDVLAVELDMTQQLWTLFCRRTVP